MKDNQMKLTRDLTEAGIEIGAIIFIPKTPTEVSVCEKLTCECQVEGGIVPEECV